MRKLFLSIFLSFVLLFVTALQSDAAVISVATENAINFTSCITPNGTVLADYPTGDHGIIGIGSKNGHDTVYMQPQGAMQCFCGSDGAGTQTNWLKTSALTEDQIKIYQNQGWIFVPSGSSWGLEDGSYLAQNINYSCNGTSTVQNTHGDGLTDGRTDGLTDGKSDGKSSIVQAASGKPSDFGLASTGNLLFIFEVIGLGAFMTILGLTLRHYSN